MVFRFAEGGRHPVVEPKTGIIVSDILAQGPDFEGPGLNRFLEFLYCHRPQLRSDAAEVDAAGICMDTKSHAARERIHQILSVLSADPLTAESDLLHEFGLSVTDAIALTERPPGGRRRRSTGHNRAIAGSRSSSKPPRTSTAFPSITQTVVLEGCYFFLLR